MNELKKGVYYRYDGREWCSGCGCNNSRHCVSVSVSLILFPVRPGAFVLAGQPHHFQIGALMAVSSEAAADEAIANGYARRPSEAELRQYNLARAY